MLCVAVWWLTHWQVLTLVFFLLLFLFFEKNARKQFLKLTTTKKIALFFINLSDVWCYWCTGWLTADLGVGITIVCSWGRWDNSDNSNKKHLTNTITTCGVWIFSKISWLVNAYRWLSSPLRCPTMKWDTWGTEETLEFPKIIVTTTGNTNNLPDSSLITTAVKTKLNIWTNHVKEFSFNLNENNAFCNGDHCTFL